MSVLSLMDALREGWGHRVSQRIARGEGVRESSLEQLNQFFEALYYSLESGDPAWMDRVINLWMQSLTESELSSDKASLSRILSEILLGTNEYAVETLLLEDAAALQTALLPIFAYAYEYATSLDVELRLENMQRELEQAKEHLEQIDKSKSDFISVAAHELKTPLTLIEGYSSMMREVMPSFDDEGYEASLFRGIDNGTIRLREIIDDMIDVSMLDNNLLSLNFQPVWINRILATLKNELRAVVRDRRQTLILEKFPGSDEMTFGDPERLYQAFKNLFVNAIKYTPDGGEIKIDGRLLPGFVEIIVRDNGIGIDPENHTSIFEKFGQAGNISLHSSGKTKFKGGGPGLGLPITKGLIEAHGGTIWVESEKQDEKTCPGSVFHVMIPVRKQPPDERTKRIFNTLVDGK
jgi:signal transduction histidine kinase